jgi:Domain of unknown function (DUF4382)
MKSLQLSIVALLAGFLAACGGAQTGKVSVKLTDASADFTKAMVTITEIDLVGSAGTTVLSTNKVTTDLLTLANDTAALVDGAVVPSGTYTQLRFVITGGYVEVPQGGGGTAIYATSATYEGLPAGAQVAGTLRMPSDAESGLKVNLPDGNIVVGTDAKVLLVDFDVAQSFGQEAGGSGAWVMHPVMTATDIELSGSVNVTMKLDAGAPVSTTLAGFTAVLTNSAGSPKALPLVDVGNGTVAAKFQYLIPGSYSISLTPPATVTSFTTSPSIPPTGLGLTVTSGQLAEEDFTLISTN